MIVFTVSGYLFCRILKILPVVPFMSSTVLSTFSIASLNTSTLLFTLSKRPVLSWCGVALLGKAIICLCFLGGRWWLGAHCGVLNGWRYRWSRWGLPTEITAMHLTHQWMFTTETRRAGTAIWIQSLIDNTNKQAVDIMYRMFRPSREANSLGQLVGYLVQ